MSYMVSLHFENPFKDSSLDTKLEALDIPLAKGDYVEVVGIWKNEDGSIGVHVEVVEKPDLNDSLHPKSDIQEDKDVPQQKIPHDHLTQAEKEGDEVLEPSLDLKKAEQEFEEEFEEAVEAEAHLRHEITKSYDNQRVSKPKPANEDPILEN